MINCKYIVAVLIIAAGFLAGGNIAYGANAPVGISRAAEEMIENLFTGGERERVNAAIRLSNFDYIEVVKALERAAAEDRSETVRRVALRSLGEIGEEESLDVIFKSFNSSLPGVRMEAILASINFSTPSVTEALVVKSTDPHPMVRQTAVKSLEKTEFFTDSAKQAVVDRFGDRSEGVRVTAVRVAGERKMEEALPDLLWVMENDASAVVRENAAAALGEFNGGREVLGALKEALDDKSLKVRINAALSLARMNSSAGLSTAYEGIRSPDARIRAPACRVIGKVGSERSRVFLERALEDMDSRVRRAAREAIDHMKERFK